MLSQRKILFDLVLLKRNGGSWFRGVENNFLYVAKAQREAYWKEMGIEVRFDKIWESNWFCGLANPGLDVGDCNTMPSHSDHNLTAGSLAAWKDVHDDHRVYKIWEDFGAERQPVHPFSRLDTKIRKDKCLDTSSFYSWPPVSSALVLSEDLEHLNKSISHWPMSHLKCQVHIPPDRFSISQSSYVAHTCGCCCSNGPIRVILIKFEPTTGCLWIWTLLLATRFLRIRLSSKKN